MNSELEFAKAGAAWLLTWSWQAFLLLSFVWLMLKLSRVKSSVIRHQLWLIGLLAIVALPICSFVARQVPTQKPRENAYVYWLELPNEVIAPAPVAAVRAVPEIITVAATDWHYLLSPLAFFAWALGFGLAVARLSVEFFTTHRLRRAASLVSLAELDCGVTHPARVGLSTRVQSPMLIGVLRPMILLPADILSWTNATERRAMIQHELAHLERRDHYVNALQTLLSAIFFFHPAVLFACRQMNLEREMACDDRVLSSGTEAETYAESILKVAERNILPRGLHQPAFFSTKQFLERRLTMIMNRDHLRTIKGSWRYLILPVSLIAVLTLLLGSGSKTSQTAAKSQDDDLVERAISDSDLNVRLATLQRLAAIKGERGTLSLLEVYTRSSDARIKESVIHSLAEREAYAPLSAIRQVEESSELRERIQQEIRDSLNRKHQAAIERSRQQGLPDDMPPPPPPPPPPPMRDSLPRNDYNFQVIGSEERTLLQPLGFGIAHVGGKRMMRMKLPNFNVTAAEMTLMDGAFYLLDQFEIDLNGVPLYGSGTLRIQPKKDSIEYALSSDGGIYLDAARTQKVGLSEFLK